MSQDQENGAGDELADLGRELEELHRTGAITGADADASARALAALRAARTRRALAASWGNLPPLTLRVVVAFDEAAQAHGYAADQEGVEKAEAARERYEVARSELVHHLGWLLAPYRAAASSAGDHAFSRDELRKRAEQIGLSVHA